MKLRRVLGGLLGLMLAATGLRFAPAGNQYNDAVAGYYDGVLDSLQTDLDGFRRDAARHPVARLKADLLRCRRRYKGVAFFIEQTDPRAARAFNGPDLLRIEDDTQNDTTRPHGFQRLEALLYGGRVDREALAEEVRLQQDAVARLRAAPDHRYVFRDDRVWESLRSGTYRLASLGITGFDVPFAETALPETRAGLEAMRTVAGLYRNRLEAAQPGLFARTDSAFARAADAIRPDASFDGFDRLGFIRDALNPLSRSLRDAAEALGVVNRQQRSPLNPDAADLFAPDAFDIAFFSPNERYRVTPARVVLGKALFSDVRLSATRTRSCATCHRPERAFTDGLAVATPLRAGAVLRNTPTLWNAALQARQFYDSRALVLETQLDAVVHSRDEMGGSLQDAIGVLATDTAYPALFRAAYPADGAPITAYTIANAIGSYIRTLLSLNAPVDRYIHGEDGALTPAAKRGFNLAMGKAKCGTCHYAPLFNGLVPPRYEESESEILAVPATAAKRSALDPDEGKYRHTGVPLHRYAFKTPTLRNSALTAPYMHNGVFGTLEAVIDFYNDGGGAGRGIALETQTLPAEKLGLTKREKADLVAFLRALTDTTGVR